MLNDKLYSALIERCATPIEAYRSLGDTVDTADGQLTYVDNGSPILAVAHLDYVMFREPRIVDGIVYCPQLDDRLGAWAILDLLPTLGVNVDVLLTDGEECGRSTGRHFVNPNDHNWMFQFDRAGTDVVLYDYDTADNREFLTELGEWEIGDGSFSDISSMTHLGIAGYNFGVGYHRQHTDRCYAILSDTIAQVCKFARFYREWNGVQIPYDPSADRFDRFDDWRSSWYDDDVSDAEWKQWDDDAYGDGSQVASRSRAIADADANSLGAGLWWECRQCGETNSGSDDDCRCGSPQWDSNVYGYSA